MAISKTAFRSDPSDEFDTVDDYQVQLVFNYFLCCVVIVLLAVLTPSVSVGHDDETKMVVQKATAGHQANLDAFEYFSCEYTITNPYRNKQDEMIAPADSDRVPKLTVQAVPL